MSIKAEGISRDYIRDVGGSNIFTAVYDTDLEIEAGSLVEIIGRSGSGKTTLINMLSGLLEPTRGRVLVDGEDLYAMSDGERSILRNRHIGIVPQGQTGLQSLTVFENILASAEMYGHTSVPSDASSDAETSVDGIDAESRAHELLRMMEIDDLSNVYSNELSGGELRRLSIARALINRPSFIIADEPTGDLDDETTADVLGILRKCADDGAAVLVVTHEKDAAPYADKIYRMEKGILTKAQV